MTKMDELELLLRETRVASRNEAAQKLKEKEASERVLKNSRIRALRESFDAERFRWFITNQYRFTQANRASFTIDQWRSLIDLEMTKEIKRA